MVRSLRLPGRGPVLMNTAVRTMAARARCGGGNVCLAEHPTPRLLTDNLDNFSNRGDRHRLSIPSTPQDKATSTLSLAPTLPCSAVIAVTEVIGNRRSYP